MSRADGAETEILSAAANFGIFRVSLTFFTGSFTGAISVFATTGTLGAQLDRIAKHVATAKSEVCSFLILKGFRGNVRSTDTDSADLLDG